jgi:hypothetical protein
VLCVVVGGVVLVVVAGAGERLDVVVDRAGWLRP